MTVTAASVLPVLRSFLESGIEVLLLIWEICRTMQFMRSPCMLTASSSFLFVLPSHFFSFCLPILWLCNLKGLGGVFFSPIPLQKIYLTRACVTNSRTYTPEQDKFGQQVTEGYPTVQTFFFSYNKYWGVSLISRLLDRHRHTSNWRRPTNQLDYLLIARFNFQVRTSPPGFNFHVPTSPISWRTVQRRMNEYWKAWLRLICPQKTIRQLGYWHWQILLATT